MAIFNRKTFIVIETGHLSKKAVSGGETIMPHMAKYLNSEYKVTVILPHFAQKHWQDQKNISFIKLPANFFERSNHPAFVLANYLWRATQTYLIIKKKAVPNSIIYSSTNSFVDILAPFLMKVTARKFKWIARIHHLTEPATRREGNFFVNLPAFVIDRLSMNCAKLADITIALNPAVYEKLLSVGFNKDNLKVLGAGVDFNYFKPEQSDKIYEGIFLGRLHRTKGVEDLVQIWSHVTKTYPQAKLAIAGEIPDTALYHSLQREIGKSGLGNNIKILGFQKKSEVQELLLKSKVFLFTDHEAGFGLAALEAMAAGLPVVGYDIGVLGNVYRKGFIKIPAYNKSIFAQEVLKLLKDNSLRQIYSKEAQEEARRHNWQTVAMKFNSILDTMSL